VNKKLADKLKKLPSFPGVYFHKNADGEVIYVGKAAVLKNRVRSYFQSKKDFDAKTLALVDEIADVDWVETDSEIDALFLESEMIKRYKPRYNIMLRDDKSQIYVRINMRDPVPYVSFTRQPADDGAEYYGPFYNSITVKNALRLLRRVFPYYTRPAEAVIASTAKQSRINFQIGLEPGVVEGQMSSAEYKKSLRQLISYIRGNRVAVIRQVEKEMRDAARRQQYEQAAHYRNQLNNLLALRKQVVFGRDEFLDASRDMGLAGLRDLLDLPDIPRRIEGFDVSHHGGTNNVASMVVFTNGMPDRAKYRKFKLRTGGSDDLAQMREVISRRLKHLRDWGRPDLIVIDGGQTQLGAVTDLLNGAGIAFIGRNKGGDHSKNAGVLLAIPAFCHSELDSESSNNDITKGDEKMTGSRIKSGMTPHQLAPNSHIAKLTARLDDEAHRFAVSYHTTLKRAAATSNVLEQIPGIGPATRKKLIRKFGSVAGVGKASEAELAAVVGPARAAVLKKSLTTPNPSTIPARTS